MPVNKPNGEIRHHAWCGTFTKNILTTLIVIALVYLTVLVGTMIRNNVRRYHYIGKADRLERTMVLQAQGKVTARPDIAETTIGFIATGDTVADVQAQNTAVMNKLIAKLKEVGVAAEDIQTIDYNIYPNYNYTEKSGRVLQSYDVTQNVKVKIRDLAKANQVLALAGEVGANSVSGLSFTIDDPEVYRDQAREKALEKIAKKVEALKNALGVNFIGIVSYNESESGGGPQLYDKAMMGGGGVPTLESGSTDVTMDVNVSFEIE